MSFAHELILFDLDGTLIETAPEICDAVNDAFAGQGWSTVEQQQVARWIGHGTRELLIQALAFVHNTSVAAVRSASHLAPVQAAFDRAYQWRCGTRSQLYPRVRPVLQALRAQGVKLAVVTNKEGRHTHALLAAHRLTPLFDRVVCGDTLARRKPDPAGILSCLDQFQVSRHHALFVGDSSIDVATARNAGVAIWALPYGYNMGEPIMASKPDRVIADCSALLAGAA